MARARKRVGQTAGKNPTKAVNVQLTESKRVAGGAVVRKKKGGVIRKPKATIRYSKSD
jgi:hypothetical protein